MFEESMTTENNIKENKNSLYSINTYEELNNIENLIKESWKAIAPFWPLKNLIAVNPLQGFEDFPIEEAMLEGAIFFEQKEIPKSIESINRLTIKWLQAFFDEGQATIGMPLRTKGLYCAWKKLAYFDTQIHGGDIKKKNWLFELSQSPEKAILECLLKLRIPKENQVTFMTLMLTTLPGWSSHIKYLTSWTQDKEKNPHSVSEADYIAIRLILTCLLWENASELMEWYRKSRELQMGKISPIEEMKKNETEYLLPLLNKLSLQESVKPYSPDAQLAFCIDVRSEPFRRALEKEGKYETFGVAGFFGIPVRINNTLTKESYASCPVLIAPQHIVNESPSCSAQDCIKSQKAYKRLKTIKALYQSLKYNFTTSFSIVELLGLGSGVLMTLKNIAPIFTSKYCNYYKETIRPKIEITPSLENITFSDQCIYAESALKAMGLTKKFASLVVLCGHGSCTENNAYSTFLDCGACGGRHGGSNAQILSKICNTKKVREYLNKVGIVIPESTYFIAAEHNTTTDEVEIHASNIQDKELQKKINQLKYDLDKARRKNSEVRLKKLGFDHSEKDSSKCTKMCSVDWSQVRPEWGLAQNASFIIAPRNVTKNVDLDGRAFLHSYDYCQDLDGTILTGILTAPMVVAQWINTQYIFSTIDNIAYGSGSKITQNVTGKIGIMQGNASDLMNGLPLQSVYKTDKESYHSSVRLMTIVYAPSRLIDNVIKNQPILQKLFRNGWVLLTCIDPENENNHFFLERDLTWKRKFS